MKITSKDSIPIYKSSLKKKKIQSLSFRVMEIMKTIQGEGFFNGAPANFIRLGGCDIGCHWCDVKESWDMDSHPLMSIDEIHQNLDPKIETLVVTGGEPFMWNLSLLTESLKQVGYNIHVETSGAYPLTGSWDWVCLSPKKKKAVQKTFYEKANELKIIIYNNHDFEYAESQSKLVSKDCKLYLQPEWSKAEQMNDVLVSYVLKHPKWKISLQTHKFLDIP